MDGDHAVHLLPEIGGIELNPITVEITYGTERAMYLQQVNNVRPRLNDSVTYGDSREPNFRPITEEGDVAIWPRFNRSGECSGCWRIVTSG
jgi:glycyl-tRNA synthetase alpha chain